MRTKFLLLFLLVFPASAVLAMPEHCRQKLDKYFFDGLRSASMPPEYAESLRCGNKKAALKIAVNYFRNRPQSVFFKNFNTKRFSRASADKAVKGIVSSIKIEHTFPDGVIDFQFNPTRDTGRYNPEWQRQLNRMFFWNDMALAYHKTGNKKYAVAFNKQMRHWIESYPCPERMNSPGSTWRTIEIGIRLMGSWQTAFEFFRKSPDFTDETLALMLATMHEQAIRALEQRTSQNWLMIELNGVYTFAVVFPEFKTAQNLRKQSSQLLCENIKKQILPDGMHSELTPGYHGLVFNCAFKMMKLARNAGFSNEITPELSRILESMANASLQIMTPGFMEPKINDCGKCHIRGILAPAFELFPHRQDFLWAASEGKKGTPPQSKTASRFLPWAGFTVMRSGWNEDALYLLFDNGPMGTSSHSHQDKLNINIYKGNEELLFDDGGGQYERSIYRAYATSSAAHNTILIDGNCQGRHNPRKIDQPTDSQFTVNEHFEYACGVYNERFIRNPEQLKQIRSAAGKKLPKRKKRRFSGKWYNPASHLREILFVKPDFFAVVDTLRSSDGKPHDYTMLLQLDTLKVQTAPGIVHGILNGKYDLYALVLSKNVDINVESAQTRPVVAGWHAEMKQRKLHPASSVKITARRQKNYRFTTLLFPLKKGDAPPVVKQLPGDMWEVKFNGRTCKLNLQDLKSNLKI